MRDLNAALDRDLVEARKLQKSLVPPASGCGRARGRSASICSPRGHVGGDLVGTFPIEPGRIGLFALDVSGHGDRLGADDGAALGVARAGPTPSSNIAHYHTPGGPRMHPPDEVCRQLNAGSSAEIGTDHYFTILIGEIDLETGRSPVSRRGTRIR